MSLKFREKCAALKVFAKINWPFLVAGFFVAFLALAYDVRSNDWSVFYSMSPAAGGKGLFFAISHGAQSRILVDLIPNYFMAQHIKIFLLITIFATFLLLYSFSKLLKIREMKFNILIALSFMFLLPFGALFTTAGPMATITNYLWPAAALTFGLTILLRKKSVLWQKIIKLFAIFYACNHEQYAVLAILLIGGFLAREIYEKLCKKIKFRQIFRENIWKFGAFFVSIAGFIFVFLCDIFRRGSLPVETKLYFPEFPNLSIPRKIDIGFVDTFQHFFVNPFFIISAILILILILAILRKKFIAGAVASFQLVFLLFPQNTEIIVKVNSLLTDWKVKNFGNLLSTNGITETSFHSWQSFLPDAYFFAMIILFLVALWNILDSRKEKIALIYILIAGTISRMILSFSPTIYASRDRTFAPMLFAMLFVLLYLARKIFFAKSVKI